MDKDKELKQIMDYAEEGEEIAISHPILIAYGSFQEKEYPMEMAHILWGSQAIAKIRKVN